MQANDYDYIWHPLLQAAAQTLVGAIGSFTIGKLLKERFLKKNTYHGALDVWQRGIHGSNLEFDDHIRIDGLISPYAQLFPGDPYQNGKKWSKIYENKMNFSRDAFRALDFFCGADQALRIKSFNGETIVGIYARYGYIGEGLLGIAPTNLIKKRLPSFFENRYFGDHVMISGEITRCPSQHWAVFQNIVREASLPEFSEGFLNKRKGDYASLPYVKIHDIRPFNNKNDTICSLLGSPWAVTDLKRDQYMMQYGHFNDPAEINSCKENMRKDKSWKHVKVYFDDLSTPSQEISFSENYIS